MIRKVHIKDADSICNIYNYYIKNTSISFEEDEIDVKIIKERIENISEFLPYVVCEVDDTIVGYAYATKWKERSSYRYTVEISVYVDHSCHNKGYGSKLYQALIEELKKSDVHVALGGIVVPNDKSIALHEKLGFEKVARLKEVGYKFNKWHDIEYWQLTI